MVRRLEADGQRKGDANSSNSRTCGQREENCVMCKVGLPVVPVKVKTRGGGRDPVLTYAFLDGGSNSTFCTADLLMQLGYEGKEISFSLGTIERENMINCRVVSLEVWDLEENEFVYLPSVYSTPTLCHVGRYSATRGH